MQGQVSSTCYTGASVTTISETLFNKILNKKKMTSNKAFPHAIRTVGGKTMPVKGVALGTFQIGEYDYTFYAYIVENLAYDVILGSDLLGPLPFCIL